MPESGFGKAVNRPNDEVRGCKADNKGEKKNHEAFQAVPRMKNRSGRQKIMQQKPQNHAHGIGKDNI
jgi:hypothetical protein